nr:putative ribonuclease H-like domain-containing protein [Tanacetum cinerariifolium]
PKWLFDIDTLTMSMNYQPVVVGNQPNDNADPKNTDDNVANDAFKVNKNENDVHVSAHDSAKTDKKKHDAKAKIDDKEKSPVDSITGVRDLRAEFKEFSFNNTNRVNAVSEPVNAAGPNPTNSTNSFNNASPPVNVVSLIFGIAGQSSFVDPSKYLDDPDIPELEDIVYSDDKEDVGAEADLSNLETNVPVSPILTTKVHKAHPVNQITGDLNSAPQTRSMTRMGHTQKEGIDFDEVFAPVARIEAIRLFLAYASFMGFMVYQMDVKSAFLYGTIKEDVYVCQPLGFEDPAYPDKDKFQMSSIGELTFFLGLQVKQKKDGIFISQDKYIAKILRKFGFTDVKLASTPIETEKPLLKDPDGEDVDVHLYRFQVTPKVSHLHAVKRIFRYLKGKPHLGLWYPRDSPFNLVAYYDSDYAGASLDRKSTTGGCQFLGSRLMSWQCKKQTDVVTSSTEAEYVDAASRCAQVLWIQNQLLDYRSQVNVVEVEKVNGDIQLHALIDDKKVVVTEAIIRRYLHLDGTDGVDCLPNAEIFEELARMGYEKPPSKLTFYKPFLFVQWKFLIHTIVQCRKLNFSKYIFDSMTRNVDTPSKFLMYPRFIQVVLDYQVDDMTTYNTRYKSLALTQKVFANMIRVGKGFSGFETPLFDSMLVQSQQQAKEGVEVPITHAQPSITSASSPTELQDTTPTPHDTPPQYQPPTPHDLPLHDQPTPCYDSFMPLLTTLMETCATLSQKVVELEKDNNYKALEILQLKKRVKRLEKKTKSKVALDAESQGKTNLKDDIEELFDQENVNAASKGVSAVSSLKLVSTAQPIVFDDEDSVVAEQVKERQSDSIKKYQDLKKKPVLVAQARKNMMIYLKNMAGYKMKFFKGMTYDEIRPMIKREYNKVQTLFKKDKDVQQTKKKRVADETLLQESFKKLRAAEVLGSESTQETPTDDQKEITKEDVQSMLEIVPVPEFKVKALQIKYPIID